MKIRSPRRTFVATIRSSCILLAATFTTATLAQMPSAKVTVQATADAGPLTSQVSGAISDASGALIGGAIVRVLRANGAVQRTTRADKEGSFVIAGLPGGRYWLAVSNPGFQTQEIPFLVRAGEATKPLPVMLGLRPVNTTVEVHGREDDLIGIADSATQGKGVSRTSSSLFPPQRNLN